VIVDNFKTYSVRDDLQDKIFVSQPDRSPKTSRDSPPRPWGILPLDDGGCLNDRTFRATQSEILQVMSSYDLTGLDQPVYECFHPS
jgi:hypothetical protein